VRKVTKERQALKVFRVCKEIQALTVHKETRERRAYKVFRVCKAIPD